MNQASASGGQGCSLDQSVAEARDSFVVWTNHWCEEVKAVSGVNQRRKHRSVLSCGLFPPVAEWLKAQDFDASAGGDSPVRAPVQAATLCPYV